MPITALSIATICYLVTGISNICQKDYPHACMWLSYTVANLSLMWYEIQKSVGK